MWHSFLNNQRTFQTTFLRNVWLQTAGITEFGASSSNATGNASSSSHTSDATYATYASMDQPSEQRLASWWSLKTSNFQTMFFSKDHQGLWKSKEISAPRHCFCYCSRCYPALNPMRGNLMATVLWQKATTFQYISIHFDTFSWFCTQPFRKEESDKVRFYQFLPSSIKYVQYSQTRFISLFNSIH